MLSAIAGTGAPCYKPGMGFPGPGEVDEAFLAEHRRLERRSRELHSLHALARGLDTVTEPDRVLALVAEAARNIAGVARAEVVAQVGTHERPWWSAPAAAPFSVEVRQAIEADLGGFRSRKTTGLPAGLPAQVLPITIERSGELLGWVLFVDPPPLSTDTRDLLDVLAGLAATTLHNFELLQDRIRSERLTTVGRMISTIVHDFRNPMTSIRGYAAMIEEMDIGPARRKECAHLVLEETERMSAMIDEILEFTSGGTPRLRRKRIAMPDLIARMQRLVEPDLGERSIVFRSDLAFRGILIVDADRMVRALLNIATNAADAMPSGGTLTVQSRERAGEVEIEVQDTGNGIAPELLPRIFEPFFTHGKPRGVGLGMAITRKIVEDHGGRIGFTSAIGVGSAFTITLPMETPAR
jgi:signal transduction histidine kinase